MKKFVFAGSRLEVFLRMLKLKIKPVMIFSTKGSRLEKFLIENGYMYKQITNKASLIDDIKNLDFDYFISNGLPYILPISKLKKGNKNFINIHPSYLPDLKGLNPINGAILYKRDAGVTCHYMDDGIDTGDIIVQIKIPYSSDLEAGLLYTLCFNAEADVFQLAYDKKFEATKIQPQTQDLIYYTIKDEDMIINLEKDSIQEILTKTKAFSVKSKYAKMLYGNKLYKILTSEIIANQYVKNISKQYKNLNAFIKYDDVLIIKKDNECIKFRFVDE